MFVLPYYLLCLRAVEEQNNDNAGGKYRYQAEQHEVEEQFPFMGGFDFCGEG
jgi:hypothetical protein